MSTIHPLTQQEYTITAQWRFAFNFKEKSNQPSFSRKPIVIFMHFWHVISYDT